MQIKQLKIILGVLASIVILLLLVFVAPNLYHFATTNFKTVSSKSINSKVKELTTQVETKTSEFRTQIGKSLLNTKEVTVTVFFGTNESGLTTDAEKQLRTIINFCTKNPTAKIKVTGYTDKTGNDTVNIPLSIQRATTVKQFLEANGCKVTDGIGYGSSEDSRKVTVTALK